MCARYYVISLNKSGARMPREFDLREAINAVSDVVANRPQPLREFDQIYMKVADMVIQAHFVAQRFSKKDLVFIGDGDAIGLAVMHLGTLNIFKEYPNSITLLDFDERIVDSVNIFAEKYGFPTKISAELYNVIDPLPEKYFGRFDSFHINPPWGASNGGESVFLFLERGIEATNKKAEGMMVIADDPQLPWTQEVLGDSQKQASQLGFLVAEMLPQLHQYHLDDAPELRSCTCLFRCYNPSSRPNKSLGVSQDRLNNFYGRNNPLKVKYIRSNHSLNYGKAIDGSYHVEPMEVLV